jgi:hypothetical protein
MFVYMSKDGMLMIISLSCLKAQKAFFITWMQTWVHDQKWYFKEAMILKNMIKK